MASPSAPRSPQGWGGGEAGSPPLPGGASRPDHWREMAFFLSFFFSSLSPFPPPPLPPPLCEGLWKAKPRERGAWRLFLLAAAAHNMAAPGSALQQREAALRAAGLAELQPGRGGGAGRAGRTKAARIMQAKPWVPINNAARPSPSSLPPPQPPAPLLL